MNVCIRDTKAWLQDDGLVLNESKTEATVIRSSSLRRPVSIQSTSAGNIPTLIIVRDLGVAIDSDLSLAAQVSK